MAEGIEVVVRYTEGHHQTVQDASYANDLRRAIEALLIHAGAPQGGYRVRILKRVPPGPLSEGNDQIWIRSQKYIAARVRLGRNNDTCRRIQIRPPEGELETAFRCLMWREHPPDKLASLAYLAGEGIQVNEVFEMVLRALTMSGLVDPHQLLILETPPKDLRCKTGTLILLDCTDKDIVAVADPQWGRSYTVILFSSDPRRTWNKLIEHNYAVVDHTAFRVSEVRQKEVDLLMVVIRVVERLAVQGKIPLADEESARAAFEEVDDDDRAGLDWGIVRAKAFSQIRDGRLYPKDWVLSRIGGMFTDREGCKIFPELFAGLARCNQSVISFLSAGIPERPELGQLQQELQGLNQQADELSEALSAVRIKIAEVERKGAQIKAEQATQKAEASLLGRIVERKGYASLQRALK